MVKIILEDLHFIGLGGLGNCQVKTPLKIVKKCQNGQKDP
jgi:hypothetical protein